jgi:protein-S-isoprenylcysteine O-methyltransferase Ste14
MIKTEKEYKGHKILLGIGVMIFSIVLWFSSSATALETNLNWPAAFFVLGIMIIIKGLFCSCYKSK